MSAAAVNSGAALNRHRSKQDVATPWELIAAVECRFGKIVYDLAATAENAKCERFITPERDSLVEDWSWLYALHDTGGSLLWLNPPYGDIEPWAKKCAAVTSSDEEVRIALLVPASVGSNWYAKYVHDQALVLALSPRVRFVGHKQGFPKDLILAVYGEEPGFEPWRWRT